MGNKLLSMEIYHKRKREEGDFFSIPGKMKETGGIFLPFFVNRK